MTATTGAASPIGRRVNKRPLAWLASLAMLAAAASPASAFVKDPVPLPHLRPGVARASASSAAAAAPAPRRAAGPMTQAELLTNVNNYFNSFRTMEGQFVQFGPHGEQSEGVFFLSRPGSIRFHYRPPVRLDVIADGSTVAVRDNKAMTQDLYPLSKTPLRYLLADAYRPDFDQCRPGGPPGSRPRLPGDRREFRLRLGQADADLRQARPLR